VQVLVVEAHEGQLDPGELAFGDVGLGRTKAQLADLLPVGIGGRAHADAGDLQDLGAHVVLRCGHGGPIAMPARQAMAAAPSRPLQHPAAAHLARPRAL
jgi:hypothetical protein